MRFTRKGEITSEQIIPLVLAVLGFLIVLGIVITLFRTSQSDDDLCKLSVLSRATTPFKETQSLIPLKCSTKKICLSSGSGKCGESFAGEKLEVVELDDDINKAADEIERVTAEAMYDCWSTMGEGKLDLFANAGTEAGISAVKTRCVICSRIAIGEKSKEALSKVDIADYMQKNQVPGKSLTYLQAFTDAGISSYPKISSSTFESKLADAGIGKENIEINADGKEIALVFMQIKSVAPLDALKNLGKDTLVLAGGSAFIPGARGVAKSIIFTKVGGLATVAVGAVLGANAVVNAYAGEALAASYCGEFVSNKEKAEQGCSLVEIVPYDFRAINQICDVIEGAP